MALNQAVFLSHAYTRNKKVTQEIWKRFMLVSNYKRIATGVEYRRVRMIKKKEKSGSDL